MQFICVFCNRSAVKLPRSAACCGKDQESIQSSTPPDSGECGVSLITPGHPRIPQDTPGHTRTQIPLFDHFYYVFFNQIRLIFIECVIKSNITMKKKLSMFCLSMNSQEITPGHLNIP